MEFNDLSVYEVPSDRRVWVVRAAGGNYVSHFRQDEVAAIGHLNILNLNYYDGDAFFPETKSLFRQLQSAHGGNKDEPNRTATAHFSQVRSFIYEIGIGDLVITVDGKSFSIGRVISDPFLDKQSVRVIYDAERERWTDMNYELRRRVKWGPLINRKSLPYVIERSFSAHQTVFNLDKSLVYIHHLLYPIFVMKERIYFSARIRKESEINNYSVSQFLAFLSEIAVLTKGFKNGVVQSLEDVDSIFKSYMENKQVVVTTKAAFMSPGEIWGQVALAAFDHKDILWFYVCWSAVFGSKLLGWEGAINNPTVHKLATLAAELFERRGGDVTRYDLEVDTPKYNTENLESEAYDEITKKPEKET